MSKANVEDDVKDDFDRESSDIWDEFFGEHFVYKYVFLFMRKYLLIG